MRRKPVARAAWIQLWRAKRGVSNRMTRKTDGPSAGRACYVCARASLNAWASTRVRECVRVRNRATASAYNLSSLRARCGSVREGGGKEAMKRWGEAVRERISCFGAFCSTCARVCVAFWRELRVSPALSCRTWRQRQGSGSPSSRRLVRKSEYHQRECRGR